MKPTTIISLLALVANVSAAKVIVGYFPNWLYAKYPVANIPFSKYTHINYAFAVLNNASYLPEFTDPQSVSTQLPELVTAAHAANVKVLLSIGGWTGSIKFSSMAAKPANRKTFIDWNIAFIKQYNTDGVDFDWEYPGAQGAGCNEIDPANDSANFATLLKELRAALDSTFTGAKRKEISTANRVYPFQTSSGPSKDVSAFVPSIDRFQLLTYDINGAWGNTTGPNSPLNYESGKGLPASFSQAIHDWNAAGVPYSKIVGGLPYYGRALQATENMDGSTQYVASKTGAPSGDSDDAFWQDPSCPADVGGVSGIWKYSNLRSQGLLTTPLKAGAGWTRYWDNVSQTPYLFNPSTKMFISYDDPASIKAKVDYALCKDIAGVMLWDIHQDNGELLDAVQGINGSPPSSCGSTSSGSASGSTSPASTSPASTSVATVSKTRSRTRTTSMATTATTATTTTAKVATTPTTKVAPTTSSGSSGGLPPCTSSNSGKSVCTSSGSSAAYSVCNNGSWMQLQCGTGTVCKTSGDSFVCDFP